MKNQVVEIAGEAVGALVPADGQFRFLAVKFSVWALDGHLFESAADAARAVAAHLSDRLRLAA